MTAEWIKVRNWDRWQSYRRDRGQPPWIKVHRCVMRDPEWVALSDAQRGQLVAIWLLAADRDGVIPASPAVVRKLCFMDSEPDLQLFVRLGFLEHGVNMASTWRQHDAPEAEAEDREEEETEKPPPSPPSNEGGTGGRARKVPVPIPPDWAPTDSHREFAAANRLDVEALATEFREDAVRKDRRMAVWNGGFTQWLKHATKPQKGGPIPDSWRPNDDHRRMAQKERLDLDRQAAAFRAHALSVDRRAADWDAAFTGWLLRSEREESRPMTKAEREHVEYRPAHEVLW